jgi:predicted metalloprotease with PDZ domain
VQAATGVVLGALYTQAVHGTRDLDYRALLSSAGVAFDAVPELLPALGLRADALEHGVHVKVALSGSAAERAGLAPGDLLVAVGGEQVNRSRWEAIKARLPVGKPVAVHFFRDGLLKLTQLSAHKPGVKEWRIWREPGREPGREKPLASKTKALWPDV